MRGPATRPGILQWVVLDRTRALPSFTLIELLVVIAIIAVLIGVLLPALGGARVRARQAACGSRLQQMGVAITGYMSDYDRTLPQAKGPLPGGGDAVIGALFAGKKGQLPFFGIDTIGAERRPLNAYLGVDAPPPDSSGQNFELLSCKSPADRGIEETGVPIPGFERADSMYDLIGASYTLNDHALDMVPGVDTISTLVPAGGGRMPYVVRPDFTVMVGSHPIYNFEDDTDRGMSWYGKGTRANILYVDAHSKLGVEVPNKPGEVENTTKDYTLLPDPDAGN